MNIWVKEQHSTLSSHLIWADAICIYTALEGLWSEIHSMSYRYMVGWRYKCIGGIDARWKYVRLRARYHWYIWRTPSDYMIYGGILTLCIIVSSLACLLYLTHLLTYIQYRRIPHSGLFLYSQTCSGCLYMYMYRYVAWLLSYTHALTAQPQSKPKVNNQTRQTSMIRHLFMFTHTHPSNIIDQALVSLLPSSDHLYIHLSIHTISTRNQNKPLLSPSTPPLLCSSTAHH